MYFIGFNSGDLEDTVQDWVVVNELDGDEDQWDEEEWGFFLELSFKVFNEDIFDEVEETSIQTDIKSTNKNINKFVELALENGDVFFNEKKEVIESEDWKQKVESSENYTISICECSTD
jgi:hypothetical protein